MIFALLFLSITFLGVSFLITKKNAPYLLSGYNSLSKAEKESVDLVNYLQFFKKFHLVLGLSLLVIGLYVYFFIGKDGMMYVMVFYPLLAYVFFTVKSSKYFKEVSRTKKRVPLILMLIVLAVITYLFYLGNKPNQLILENHTVKISGMYGVDLNYGDIESVELVKSPELTKKVNGYADGKVKKGYFKTQQGEKVLLFLQDKNSPVIYLQSRKEVPIYFSLDSVSTVRLYEELLKIKIR